MQIFFVCMSSALRIKAFHVPLSPPHNEFACRPPPHNYIHMHALQQFIVCLHVDKNFKLRHKIKVLTCAATAMIIL